MKKSRAKKILKRAENSLNEEIEKKKQQNQLQHLQVSNNTIKPTFPKKTRSKKLIESQLNKSLKEAIDSKTDITELVKKINSMGMLEGACLEKHHQILLPLLVLRSKQSPRDQAQGSSHSVLDPMRSSNGDGKKGGYKNILVESTCQEEESKKASNHQESERSSVLNQNFYNALRMAKPRNSFEKMLNDELFSYLWLVYEQDQG